MSSLIGKQIDNYKILEKIGEGGMGIVYKAIDVDLDRLVAIKQIEPNRAARDRRYLNRFKAEAKTLAHLEHPNIVTIHRWLPESEDGFFIVMEYVDGISLEDYLKREGPMPYQKTLAIVKTLLQAIGYAHSKNVIHRDIKPGNVMLSSDGIAKLMDFGLAKIKRDENDTRTMHSLGTVDYMSPEQIKSPQSLDSRTDIYSLGMTIYKMLAGKTPVEDSSSEHSTGDYGKMKYIIEKKFQPPKIFNPEIPERVNKIVMKALEKRADKRYQNSDEMLHDIVEFEKSEESLAGVKKSPKSNFDFNQILEKAQPFLEKFSDYTKGVLLQVAQYSKTFINKIRTKAQKFQTTALFDKFAQYKQYIFLGFVAVIAVFVILRIFLIEPPPAQAPAVNPGPGNPPGEPAPIAVTSLVVTPTNAKVIIDSRKIDSSEFANLSLRPGQHQIHISLAGYETIEERFELQPGQNDLLKYTLSPLPATVSIIVNPQTAIVTVNGDVIPESKRNNLELIAGIYEIIASKKGYKTEREQLRLEPGKNYTKNYHLILKNTDIAPVTRKKYKLRIDSTPGGATVRVDGRVIPGKTPVTLHNVTLGVHKIEITKNGYKKHTNMYEVNRQDINHYYGPLEKTEIVWVRVLAKSPSGKGIHGEIYINNRSTRKSTPYKFSLNIGNRYTVEVRKRGYKAAAKIVMFDNKFVKKVVLLEFNLKKASMSNK